MKWKYCLTETSDRHFTALASHLFADFGFHVPFPKLFERQLPGKSVHFLATTKPSFVYHPPKRLHALMYCTFYETRGTCAVKLLGSRLPGLHVDQALK
jgi:hypothetical protein